MAFNPFKEKAPKINDCFMDWQQMSPKSYDKHTVDPYTRTRCILMNGAEFNQVWFSHMFSRNCNNNDLRRDLAVLRRSEQQQQKRIAALKPKDESVLETTIGYEQLAVDLTAEMAINEPDKYFASALNFALLEDFDHLYRYADLLEMEQGISAEKIVGGYTEIMPGRPTIAEHRYPSDEIKQHLKVGQAQPISILNACTITAAEQQTMNYYMNVGSFQTTDLGRKLYAEIAMIEEQHVTMYGSFIDTSRTFVENLLLHEYGECYLYYSVFMDESDQLIKEIWEQHLNMELAHLQMAAELLKIYDGKEWQEVLGKGDFPKLLKLKEHKDYVRDIIRNEVTYTEKGENFIDISKLPEDYQYFKYQENVNSSVKDVASHKVIVNYIDKKGKDYRYEVAPHPIECLSDRTRDNTEIARK
ncbi:MAG: hypothetical protein RR054_01175 [Clostridia bacterium]